MANSNSATETAEELRETLYREWFTCKVIMCFRQIEHFSIDNQDVQVRTEIYSQKLWEVAV